MKRMQEELLEEASTSAELTSDITRLKSEILGARESSKVEREEREEREQEREKEREQEREEEIKAMRKDIEKEWKVKVECAANKAGKEYGEEAERREREWEKKVTEVATEAAAAAAAEAAAAAKAAATAAATAAAAETETAMLLLERKMLASQQEHGLEMESLRERMLLEKEKYLRERQEASTPVKEKHALEKKLWMAEIEAEREKERTSLLMERERVEKELTEALELVSWSCFFL